MSSVHSRPDSHLRKLRDAPACLAITPGISYKFVSTTPAVSSINLMVDTGRSLQAARYSGLFRRDSSEQCFTINGVKGGGGIGRVRYFRVALLWVLVIRGLWKSGICRSYYIVRSRHPSTSSKSSHRADASS